MTALDLLSELSSLLEKSHDATELIHIQEIIASLRVSLKDRGYKEGTTPVGVSYTVKRAQSLVEVSKLLLRALEPYPTMSYTDKAVTCGTIASNYLQLAHAFKVDKKVWDSAQSDLVPVLSSAVDEKSLDLALVCLNRHINTYIKSLGSWL